MRKRLANQVATTRAQVAGLDPTVQGMLWTTAAGLMFVCLNSLQRVMSQQLDPLQAQFLRYGCGLLVMLPLVLRAGFAAAADRRPVCARRRAHPRSADVVFGAAAHPVG